MAETKPQADDAPTAAPTEAEADPPREAEAEAEAEADADPPGEAEAEAEAAPETEATAEEIEPLRAEMAALEERLMRALAETENLRRRTEREREEVAKYAVTGFARDIVSIADDLARAVGGADTDAGDISPHLASMLEGIRLALRNLDSALDRQGIVCIDPVDEKFDHNFHEAMFELDAPGKAPGTVVQVVQRGYRIHDRLLRPARVGVVKRGTGGGVDTEA